MSYTLKPIIPDGYTFDGELVFNSTEIEIPSTFKNYVENLTLSIEGQYSNKYTGFETKKYSLNENDTKFLSITLVNDLPRWLCDLLQNLAIAMNGEGMILEFVDDWITGTIAVPQAYNCRWVNAGDFTDNSELLCGASIDLIVYLLPSDIPVEWYQKVVDTPLSGLEWVYNIDDIGVDFIYYRVK